MRRVCAIALCSTLCLLVLPERANAWWDIIEELSGPGRFYGWDLDLRLFCLNDKVDATRAGTNAPDTERVGPTVGAVVSACRVKKGYARRLGVNLGARFLKADDNSRFANGERISLTTLEPAISFNLLSRHPDKRLRRLRVRRRRLLVQLDRVPVVQRGVSRAGPHRIPPDDEYETKP